MKILFIGYSNLIKERILPIIDKLVFIDSICIAKYDKQSWDDSYKCILKPLKLYDNYKIAIQESNADIAYISTTNHSHYVWAKAALNAGLHTIIDKPATINLAETEMLIRIARKQNLLLSESTVYTYHPQLSLIKTILNEEQSSPKLLTVIFSFPPMDDNNFRYNKDLGGGALLDTSPYVVSIGRFFFEEIPLQSHYIENSSLPNGLEISYSLLLKYSDGRSLIGHFGFNTEYINRLNILGNSICIDIDRIFTIPDSEKNLIKVRVNNKIFEQIAPSGNMFELFFKEIYKRVKDRNFYKLSEDMLMDSKSRDLINKSKTDYDN